MKQLSIDIARGILNFLNKYKYIFFLCILGIVPYLFYSNINAPYNAMEYYSNKVFFTTWSNISFGSFRFFLYPVDYLIYLLSMFFSSPIAIRFFYSLFLTIGGVSTFFVIRRFVKNEFIAFVGALFYMYGIFEQFASFWYQINLLIAILPVITLRIVRISKKTNTVKEIIIISFLLFLLTGENLTFIAYLLLWMAILGAYKISELGWKQSYRILTILIVGGLLSLFLSSYYYLALFAEFHYQSSIINTSLALESPVWKSSASWLQELIREMGAVPFYYYFKGFSYPNAQPFISNLFFIFISYIFPFLAFLSLLLYRRLFKENTFLILLFLSLIFLFFMAMGVFFLAPTKDIYWWLYDHIPYFSIFRDAYKPMFLIHFIYAILIGYSLNYFYKYQKKFFKWVAVITIVCIFIISYQFWSGTFLLDQVINIPKYWINFGHYMVNRREKVTLTLPSMNFTGYDFTTHKGENTSFYRPILDNNVIYEEGGSVYDDNLVKTLYGSVIFDPSCVPKLAGMTGITYLLNQYDLYTDLYDSSVTAAKVEASLRKIPQITFDQQFGKLKLYSLDPKLIYDDVYLPEQIITGDTQNYCTIAEKSTGKNNLAVISQSDFIKTSITPASITFENLNNAMHAIHINNMQTDQLLVLNKRYDGGWKIFELSTGEKPTLITILSLITHYPLDAKHIGVNGFANGWYVQKTIPNRNFVLIYMPQLYFYWGLVISSVTFIILVSVYILGTKKNI